MIVPRPSPAPAAVGFCILVRGVPVYDHTQPLGQCGDTWLLMVAELRRVHHEYHYDPGARHRYDVSMHGLN
jgi:hypothetical protein